MSTIKPPSSEPFLEKKSETEPLDTVIEVNENVPSEIFDRPYEEGEFDEISPRIFSIKDCLEPMKIKSLNNAIYELGIVNLCWPEITEPVFETRTCFPKSYYTNNTKERLLLAYAENFRRQYQLHFKMRKPFLLQVPNECGLQVGGHLFNIIRQESKPVQYIPKMVCTSIRPTKLCYAGMNTWQGVASLVADYFDYEPLTKPMLHLRAVWTRRLLASCPRVGRTGRALVRAVREAHAKVDDEYAQLMDVLTGVVRAAAHF